MLRHSKAYLQHSTTHYQDVLRRSTRCCSTAATQRSLGTMRCKRAGDVESLVALFTGGAPEEVPFSRGPVRRSK